MSIVPLMFPVQAKAVLEQARGRLSKKEFGGKLGYTESEYSKALNAVRPFDLNDVMATGDDEAQRAIAEAWLKALNVKRDRDLVADLCGRVERLLDSLGPRHQAKADLRDAEERKTA